MHTHSISCWMLYKATKPGFSIYLFRWAEKQTYPKLRKSSSVIEGGERT